MKLPAHVLTKLCLAGAAGAVIVAIGCEHATPRVTEERAEPVIVETTIETEMPTMETFRYSQPPPGAAPRFEPPPPTPIRIPVKLVPKKKAPQPIARAHACGPCGMG